MKLCIPGAIPCRRKVKYIMYYQVLLIALACVEVGHEHIMHSSFRDAILVRAAYEAEVSSPALQDYFRDCRRKLLGTSCTMYSLCSSITSYSSTRVLVLTWQHTSTVVLLTRLLQVHTCTLQDHTIVESSTKYKIFDGRLRGAFRRLGACSSTSRCVLFNISVLGFDGSVRCDGSVRFDGFLVCFDGHRSA
jgi:hypothetical protein